MALTKDDKKFIIDSISKAIADNNIVIFKFMAENFANKREFGELKVKVSRNEQKLNEVSDVVVGISETLNTEHKFRYERLVKLEKQQVQMDKRLKKLEATAN